MGIGRRAGDPTPDTTQRLLTHEPGHLHRNGRDAPISGDRAAGGGRCGKRRRGLVIGAIDGTGQETVHRYRGSSAPAPGARAGQPMGSAPCTCRTCAGHALIGARQRIPREHIEDPVKSLLMGLPLGMQFHAKGQLASDLRTDAYADASRSDFPCEVCGNCMQLR